MTKTSSHDREERRIGPIRRKRPMHGDLGQTLIELALAVPIFTLLLLGAAEFALLAYASIEVTNAARAGVAYGSQSAATASDLAGMRTMAINDGSNVAGLSATASQFCSCSSAAATPVACATAPTTCASSHVLNYVKVTTTAPISPPIHLPGLPTTFTLSGQAIMRVE